MTKKTTKAELTETVQRLEGERSAILAALEVLTLTTATRLFFLRYDPKALEQAEKALEAFGSQERLGRARENTAMVLERIGMGDACPTCGEPLDYPNGPDAEPESCRRCEEAKVQGLWLLAKVEQEAAETERANRRMGDRNP